MQSKLTPAGAVANPLTMARIRNAIELAQQHLNTNQSEEIEELATPGATALATDVSDTQQKKKRTQFEESDAVTAEQLKAEIAECHCALTALQKTAEGKTKG
eukprot:710232-Rhodomonas_salina.1